MTVPLVVGTVLLLLVAGLALLVKLQPRIAAFTARQARRLAIETFRANRDALNAAFFEQASRSGVPEGLIWEDAQWGEDVRFAEDDSTGELVALAEVSLGFSADPDGDMVDVPAVAERRNAVAVFHHTATHRWGSGGRVLFNLSPAGAVGLLEENFRPVEPPLSRPGANP